MQCVQYILHEHFNWPSKITNVNQLAINLAIKYITTTIKHNAYFPP